MGRTGTSLAEQICTSWCQVQLKALIILAPMDNVLRVSSGCVLLALFVRASNTASVLPSGDPSGQPSGQPSGEPSGQPSGQPTGQPSGQPSSLPSTETSGHPSGEPSGGPDRTSGTPSPQPSGTPTEAPSERPSSQLGGRGVVTCCVWVYVVSLSPFPCPYP